MAPSSRQKRMPLVPALEVLRDLRRDEIVITTMGAAREWPRLSQHPLDFHYIPSAMGEAPALGLGIALAKPGCEVIVLNGDGCMLMNLGSLVTIVASGANNLTLLVLDNGIYEVTGGQQTVAAQAAGHARVDFAGLAQAAGFASVVEFSSLEEWSQQAAGLLSLPGPRFGTLAVEAVGAEYLLESPGPMAERLSRFEHALRVV